MGMLGRSRRDAPQLPHRLRWHGTGQRSLLHVTFLPPTVHMSPATPPEQKSTLAFFLHCKVCPKCCPSFFSSPPLHIQVALVTIFARLGMTAKLVLIKRLSKQRETSL